MARIEKKILSTYYNLVASGDKTFELRLADWECKPGDTLILLEVDDDTKEPTGRTLEREVGFIGKTKDLSFWSQKAIDKYGYQIISLQQPKKQDHNYWSRLDELVKQKGFKNERPKGSAHPRYPNMIYPLDYGYIPETDSSDGAEIDAWRGSLEDELVTGAVATYDGLKKDMEMKVLIGCSKEDIEKILAHHDQGDMVALYVDR